MSVLQRHPRLRWLLPLVALALVLGGPAGLQRIAQADPGLPPRTAQQLLTDLIQAKPQPLSGTVQQEMNLGLPALPSLGQGGPHGQDISLMGLLLGNHTWRVWTNAQDSFRVAKVNGSEELNIIHNPDQTWIWNSSTREAVKAVHDGKDRSKKPGPTPTPTTTPGDLAKKLLEAVDPSTAVSVDSNTTVAGRAAYQLVLTPKSGATKVGQIRIAVDGDNLTPLRVAVTARGASSPAIQVAFSTITFGTPDPTNFQFTPPSDAKVVDAKQKMPVATTKPSTTTGEPSHKVVGEGWAQVHVVSGLGQVDTSKTPELEQLLGQFPTVSGAWGQGRLVETALFSAVLTKDGRLAIGAVQPTLLYAALG